MFKLINVNKSFETPTSTTHALHNINLSIPAGQIYGIIGTSGAGKSTLLRCLNGLEVPSVGHVMFEDKDLTLLSSQDLRHTRQQIGMIFQHFNLLSSCTVYENIALPLEINPYFCFATNLAAFMMATSGPAITPTFMVSFAGLHAVIANANRMHIVILLRILITFLLNNFDISHAQIFGLTNSPSIESPVSLSPKLSQLL